MKLRIWRPLLLPAQSQRSIRWARHLLFTIGIVALAYVGLTLLDANLYQKYQTRQFQQELNDSQASIVSGVPVPALQGAKPARTESLGSTGSGRSALGRIEINAIGLSAMILEGIDGRTLRRAVGHIPGTPLPGQTGNVGLAGHRDTFFRALRNIHPGDDITLQTLSGLYHYRVDSTKVVDPGATLVLNKSDDAILTLVTCYPFSYLGPAPKRFIVRAHKIPTTTAEPGSTS